MKQMFVQGGLALSLLLSSPAGLGQSSFLFSNYGPRAPERLPIFLPNLFRY
jgi:hypothetical protein